MIRMTLAWLGLGALLAGCNQEAPATKRSTQTAATQENAAAREAGEPAFESVARVGPLRFGYDRTALTLAELQIEVPPGYDDPVWAVKLIPADRARLLGEEGCRYGQSGLEETCNARDEPGLVLALLERPLADYRQAFAAQDLNDALAPARIDGAQGFSFTSQAEGSGVEYRFVAVDQRTLLVARRFSAGQQAGAEAIDAVIASVASELAEHRG